MHNYSYLEHETLILISVRLVSKLDWSYLGLLQGRASGICLSSKDFGGMGESSYKF